ncbi:MAG: endonuclease/exonuclease/phosphatase family protein [Gallionellaceae bacterium]|nr:endonuclease/exonuclease/phosphatase family protein [Gallionellaceae bacterium]MDD5366273.1 endonuclease/exonuclease/phosphatase family protein [Gallionellaceae bacterium]
MRKGGIDGLQPLLHIASYNIHKGLSFFNRRMVMHELKDRLKVIDADIVFLQEVQGSHAERAERFNDWPDKPQHEFLASDIWTDMAYGKNAVYDHGHHGNAILARYPILRWENVDISSHVFESRGLLHCELAVPNLDQPLHAICLHLALNEQGRRKQLLRISQHIRDLVPDGAPLIMAGDFNDWRQRAPAYLAHELGLMEVFETFQGRHALSFPAALPLFALDRIYVRGFRVASARVHHGSAWRKLSDHAALTAQLMLA